MRLTTAEIDRYGPLFDCRPECGDGITVLSGDNEAGKTLYIEALLQLLDPGVADVMSPRPRVDQTPTGRVIVEYGGEEFECDGNTALSDISDIEPSQLDSVFVVRDNDLQLPSESAYYTSLIEKLGDIHTTEINAIKSALKDRGRLTDRRLNISSDQSHNDAGTVRDNADSLATEIREYTGRIKEEGLDQLETDRLRVKRQLKQARAELRVQREAERVSEYHRLTDQLDTYRQTSDRLEALQRFERDELDELRELRNDIDRDSDRVDELETEIAEQEAEVDEIEARLEQQQEELTELNQREASVETARSALETYRDRQDDATGAERRLSISRATAIAGVLAAGLAGGLGAVFGAPLAIGLGALLLLGAAIAGGLYYRTDSRLSAIESARESVLQSARDAGFTVENVEAVAPAIEGFDTKLAKARDRVAKSEQRLEDALDTLEDLRGEYSELEDSVIEAQQTLEDRLSEAGVESIENYADKVESKEDLKPHQQTAKQSLVDRFGEPDKDDPEGKADAWERDLSELISDIDLEEVDAETYAEAELERLQEREAELQDELEDLQAKLSEHDDELDHFDRQVSRLNTEPFIGRSLSLESRSKAGLETLAKQLDEVVDQIEEDAELSRKALELFETIEQQEEEKLTTLFDPDGPASETFERLTNGRYTEVGYDADAHDLLVERRDGRTFRPDVLSQGTKDQLYFATRVSLAQQLLGNEPGFLLLDDSFLAADPDRLRNGFESLVDLADSGWQILYMTAKEEVSETMVDEYDLNREQLGPIPMGETTS